MSDLGHEGPPGSGYPYREGASPDDRAALPPGYSDHEPWPEEEEAPPDYRRRPPGGRGRRRRAHPVLVTLLVILAVILLIGVGLFIWANGQINPGGRRGPAVSVVIPKGSSTSKIGSILAKAGVIHEGSLFALYVRINGDGPLYPGTYSLPKNESYKSAISALESGPKIVTDALVIPEGFTVRQIADAVAALPHLHLSAQKFLTLISSGQVRSPYEPAGGNNLEGLLFPATYQVSQGQTESDVLEDMIGAFDDRAQSLGLTQAASALHLSAYQVITVASIVEREAKLDSDRGPVASVIYNRLHAGMPLGADSTQTYYLRLTDPTLVPTATQLNQPGPYNTRLNTGLPPTPIANPGLPPPGGGRPAHDHLPVLRRGQSRRPLGLASTSSGSRNCRPSAGPPDLC